MYRYVQYDISPDNQVSGGMEVTRLDTELSAIEGLLNHVVGEFVAMDR